VNRPGGEGCGEGGGVGVCLFARRNVKIVLQKTETETVSTVGCEISEVVI
jgi:hypothetical protein